ncbi:PDR/VanB family oxidoreductase [Mycolicibacterium murale]|uniref:PDR/VanB family oxidoreductase n=1 Tax=Mycolicibacterium murale TaxID=182220 RepID=UPI001FE8149E|nr:PDR/VanB family oxidoreductase [Mycolicibacterium murale]
MTTGLRSARVTRRIRRAEGVIGLTLSGVDGALPSWTPGAHIDVLLPSGQCRQYSLCGPVTSRDYEIAVRVDPNGRGGSREVHEALRPDTTVTISEPRNRFALERAQSYLFVAGGIGITPLLPMVEAVDALGLDWQLVYCGRTRASMPFRDELEMYSDRVRLWPDDERGVVDVPGIVRAAVAARPDVAIYTCGPGPLIDAMKAAVCAAGAAPLRFERFTAAPEMNPTVPQGASGFEVQLGVDGPVLAVGEKQSVLQAVLDAGADVLYSCEEGTCGSCQTTVLDGVVDHRDDLLSDAERADRQMLICVSRCAGDRLVLDIPAP